MQIAPRNTCAVDIFFYQAVSSSIKILISQTPTLHSNENSCVKSSNIDDVEMKTKSNMVLWGVLLYFIFLEIVI